MPRRHAFTLSPCHLVTLSLLSLTARAATPATPLNSVDLFIGVRGDGSCVPGPCLPNGSIHPSPDTIPAGNGGYARGPTPRIVGFSQLHVQGTGGNKSYGNFLLTPQIGDGPAQPLAPDDELATATRYRCRLPSSAGPIACEVTSAAHSAIYRFTFPRSEEATLLVDVGRKLDLASAITTGHVKVDAASGTITGGGHFTRNWNPAPYDVYFAAQVSKAPGKIGTWVGGERRAGVGEAEIATPNTTLGAYLQWSTAEQETIAVKIAVSFTSAEQAAEYLRKEIPAWDFEAVEKDAAARWEKVLALATLEGAAPDEEKKFYTALYHTMVQPRYRTGDNPNWKSEPGTPFLDDQYTLWDTWRTEFPLMAILRPELVRDTVNSFLDRHAHNGTGLVGTAFVQGKEMHTGQGGDEADIIIADARVKGIAGVDWQKAYEFLKFDAENGRTPEYRVKGFCSLDTLAESQRLFDTRFRPAGATLAFSYADFCVAQVAHSLGQESDFQKYLARSANWKNVWDDAMSEGAYSGFPHNRHASGVFADRMGNAPASPRGGYNTDFYEGTPWICSYGILQDFEGMVEKMGGRERFLDRLQFAMKSDLIDYSNEPSFQTIWWFSAAGRPDQAALYADKLRQRYTVQGYPGDEDDGAMSSLYIFLTAGFFPIAGQDIYYLHGVRVPRVTFQLGGGKTFSIIGRNAGAQNIYVQSATLNGKPLEKPIIHHAEIAAGGTLEFVMGPEASRWGLP